MGYRIKTVAERLGIPKNTLIAWEQRYAFPRPERLANGYRVYSDQDVADLETLKRLLDSGLQVSEALERLRRTASAPHHTALQPGDRGAPDVREPGGAARELTAPVAGDQPDFAALEPLWRHALDRLLEFDRPGAEQALIARTGMPFALQVDGLFFPLLREVGAGWQQGRISVAQEHFASAFCRDHLALMLLQLEGRAESPRPAICASIGGERHELGALGLAVRLAFSGQRVIYLGADVPAAELCRCALAQDAASVWVSIIGARSEEEVLEYARTLTGTLPPEVEIVMGGSGLPERLDGRLKRVRLARRYEEVLERRA